VISTLVAALVVGLCVAWSAQRLAQARRFDRDGAPELLQALGHGGRERAGRVAAEHREQWAAVSALVEVLDAPSHDYGVAMINEQLADVRRELDANAEVPRAAARIAAAAGTALSVLGIARGLPGGGLMLGWVAAPFLLGLTGALACAQLGRAAERHVVHHREAWNGLRSAFSGLLPAEQKRAPGESS
jgi:hypothetical protein